MMNLLYNNPLFKLLLSLSLSLLSFSIVKDEPRMILANVCSFVEQLDIHAPYLTVQETFDFAYECRTGKKARTSTIKKKKSNNSIAAASTRSGGGTTTIDPVQSENLTIEGLGLAHVADTFVGNNQVRGVSGGQRRRVTVGEMMQGDYPVACADEISTGLDAAVTHDICESICEFSRAMYTTRIVSLLQPGPETFCLFDEVIVLSEGYVIYAGPPGEIMNHFNSLGYKLPAIVDVADFLQIVSTADGEKLFHPEESPYDHHLTSKEFADEFQKTHHAQRIRDMLANKDSPYNWSKHGNRSDEEKGNGTQGRGKKSSSHVPQQFTERYKNSWWRAMTLNFNRFLTLWLRDTGFIIGKTCENIGMAVAVGGIMFNQASLPAELKNGIASDSLNSTLQYQTILDNVYAAYFMTCLHLTLGTTTSAPDDLGM